MFVFLYYIIMNTVFLFVLITEMCT